MKKAEEFISVLLLILWEKKWWWMSPIILAILMLAVLTLFDVRSPNPPLVHSLFGR